MTQPQIRRLPTGKLPAQPARPHLRLSAGITTALPTPPASVMYDEVADWGMEGNDAVGDCVEAYIAHAVEQITRYVSGTERAVTSGETIALYSSITGYDPRSPATDQGTNMQDALTYWRKIGVFGGHKIAAFAAVNLTDWREIENAVNWFGHVTIGFNFPDSAMTQFNDGEPWTVVAGSPVDGGHCVMLIGYDADWLYVVTWGRVQKMDRKFWAVYVDEAWVPVTQETITTQGGNAFGGLVDLAALGQAFAALTNDPNPFPAPTPVPDPTPAPTPSPVYVIDPADQRLHDARIVHHLLSRGHINTVDLRTLRHAVEQWERDKGFPVS